MERRSTIDTGGVLLAALLPVGAAGTATATGFSVPVHYEENLGQAPEEVRFLARGRGFTLYLSAGEVIVARGESAIRMRIAGAAATARIGGLDRLPARSHYLIGRDPARWRTDVPRYGRVRYQGIYPGVDLVVHAADSGELEYDFVLAPGADPRAIRLSFPGLDSRRIEPDGDLVLVAARTEIRHRQPRVYQEDGRGRTVVDSRWLARNGCEVGFAVGDYDRSRRLVIDPVLSFSTYLGGSSADNDAVVAVDAGGNVYVVGSTLSADFPLRDPVQADGGSTDCFVTKLAPDGSSVFYSTYVGGSDRDDCKAVAVDAAGAFVTGATRSNDFPVVSALQSTFGGGAEDAVVFKLNPQGSALVYSTYLGGAAAERGFGVALDGAGSAFVVGWTSSPDFPLLNPIQASHGQGLEDAFVSKLSPDGRSLVYSTFLGGSGRDHGDGIAVDRDGLALVAGETQSADFPTRNPLRAYAGEGDAFVARLSPDGRSLVFSTFLGGSGLERARGIAVDGDGNGYAVGSTASLNFPTRAPLQPTFGGGLFDGFLTKLDQAGAMVYSTYLGGRNTEDFFEVASHRCGVVVAGISLSDDYPTAGPLRGFAGSYDGVVSVVDAAGSALLFSTHLGGTSLEDLFGAAVHQDAVWLAGGTLSVNFPTVSALQPFPGGESDAFVARIDLVPDLCCTDPVPGPVGNTLLATRDIPARTITLEWGGVPGATGYDIYQDEVKSGPLLGLTGSAPPGTVELTIALPPEPLLFYRVAGTSCAGVGPK